MLAASVEDRWPDNGAYPRHPLLQGSVAMGKRARGRDWSIDPTWLSNPGADRQLPQPSAGQMSASVANYKRMTPRGQRHRKLFRSSASALLRTSLRASRALYSLPPVLYSLLPPSA